MRQIVFGTLLGILIIQLAFSAPVFACSPTSGVTGCVGDDDVIIEGDGGDNTPGGPGGGGGGGGGGTDEPIDDACDLRECFEVDNPPTPDRDVTWSDIARFRPTPGVDHMQPNGWMVVGLPTNFYATGGAHIVTGQLLGYPTSVRFTPVRWHWMYGDGESASRSVPGTTWASQRASEFDKTPTSHVYDRAGTYYIDLSIDYTAEYRFAGSGWVSIDGTLTLPANRLVATAGSAKTVLVEDECTRNPRGPGC